MTIFINFTIFATMPWYAYSSGVEEPPADSYLFIAVDQVTLEKVPESPEKIPVPVTMITTAELKLFNFRTLGEALRSVTGVIVGNDPVYDQILIRGTDSVS
jgi:hypothetical protein